MPGSIPHSMAVQKKQSVIPPSQGPLSSRTSQSQRKGKGFQRTRENGAIKPNSQESRRVTSAPPRPAAVANGQNIDERLKAARERREEHMKLLASRELGRLERERRAQRYHEQQLQERKKKLLDQRVKEERRRAAVEGKRKQRLQEEKERNESAVRKTLEKSQRAQQTLVQNSRGRKPTKNVPRRTPLTTWEKNLVSRLLIPTCSFLARSKSAGCESGQEVSFHSMNTTTTTITTTSSSPRSTTPHKLQQPRPSASPSPSRSQHRSLNLTQVKTPKQPDANKKKSNNVSSVRSPPVNGSVKPAVANQRRAPTPSPERTPRRSIRRQSTPLQLDLPSVPEEDVAVCRSDLSPGNSRPVRTSAEGRQDKTGNSPETPCSNLPSHEREAVTRTSGDGSPSKMPSHPAPQPPEVISKPSAGTTDRVEASRLLAEKRREARMQREKEEQERLQREEAERRSREQLEQKRAEEQARQQAEAERLVEEKRRREEEEQRQAEEERAQAMREAALLQKQREEEQARERAKADQIQRERETLAQKEEADRQVRKKRLEEIMRRTRRTDSPDTKSVPVRIMPKENTEPVHKVTIEDAIKLPVGSRPSQLGLNNEEDMVPVVAFKERRSLRSLTGLEEIQTHQRAEVI